MYTFYTFLVIRISYRGVPIVCREGGSEMRRNITRVLSDGL